MKQKLISITLTAIIIATALTLTACGEQLAGVYVNDALGTETSYNFRGENVTVTVTTTLLGNVITKAYEGEYEITTTDGGKQFIELDFESEKAGIFEGAKTFSQNKDDGTITIGGIEYTKKNNEK
ncbi:MAG: hypothetical protein E7627_08205 [Ruminococcaceae bacterium]|nr:hypothetical protein [Oscillospiraceae bacterium]